MPLRRATPDEIVRTAILVLGAPRSGTTWLAKILDSHPDVLYRHEPDEIVPTPAEPTAADIVPLLRRWLGERGVRTATKRPFFAKSWQTRPAWALRVALAYGLNGAARLPGPPAALARLPVPDLITPGATPRLVLKSVRWHLGAGVMARALPASRTLLILRHPCGQVASVMRGARQRRFDLREAGTDMPFDEAEALARAAHHGVGPAAFRALPDAAQYAWSWVAFNEAAHAALSGQPNTRTIIYEDLCRRPEAAAREVLDFAGLAWNEQTASFIARSTSHDGPAGYYAVFRNAIQAAERWRTAMAEPDQHAVRRVARHSPLARFWPDLAGDGR